MVVTDKLLLQQQLHTTLEEQGYRVTTVETGELAIQSMQQHTSSLIIIELETDNSETYELIKLLKNNERSAAIPVVALTGTELSEQEKEWLVKESITCVLIENIEEQEQLLNKIRLLLEPKKSRHEAA